MTVLVRLLGLAAAAALASLALFQPALAQSLRAEGIPPAYSPVVIEPTRRPGVVEFDLAAVAARARREQKSLYVYLGAHDCEFCRRYEAFLDANVGTLPPHFSKYIVVDLRSALSVDAARLHFRLGQRSLAYADFQRAIGDQRARVLVYPTVWLLDPDLQPLMQMPAGAGTFQTFAEQLEILQLVQ